MSGRIFRGIFLLGMVFWITDGAAQGIMRWRIQSIENRYKENYLTSSRHNYYTHSRKKLNVVTVKMRHVTKNGEDIILFDAGEMKNQIGTDEITDNYIPYRERDTLISNLKYAARQMRRISNSLYSTNLCEIGTIQLTLKGEKNIQTLLVKFKGEKDRKKYYRADYDEEEAVFELPKPQVERFLFNLKSFRE